MNWPKQVPFFTPDDVHQEREYEIKKDGKIKRCAMGWFNHLFVDFSQFGAVDLSKRDKAESILRKIAAIPKRESIEEWNDKPENSLKNIAAKLNRVMKELGYEVEK